MRVYRIISAREITNIYKGIDEREPIVKGENTHKYDKGVNYIHFFRYYESAEYYFKRYRAAMNLLDEYVLYMVANIPESILKECIGYGFYNLDEEGFRSYDIPVPEYALRMEKMKPEYVVEVNSLVKCEYKNNHDEYKKYLALMKTLAKKYQYDFHRVSEYLESNILEELLGVQNDDRTESEIVDDYVKSLSKIFPLYD